MAKVLLFLLAFSLGFVIGCKKQQRTDETPPSVAGDAAPPESPTTLSKRSETQVKPTEKLRGASVVRDDLKRKDYARAVEGVVVLRAFAVNDEQWLEYRELSSEVAQALVAAAPTDPNAAKALAAYNLAMYGR
jgi:hypothetical protein